MPSIRRSIDDVRARVGRLFASKASRFRLAVSCGFVVAAVGAVSLGFGDRPGFAQEFGGMSGFFGGDSSFFGQPTQQPITVQREPHYRSRRAQRASLYDRIEQHHLKRAVLHRVPRDNPVREAKADTRLDQAHGGPMTLNRVSMCVRTCDGFAFPVGAYHGEQDRASHEATCQSECPGAQTALYVLPAGADTLGEAMSVKSGKAYSALPQAFHYTTVLSDACTCHAKSGGRIASLLHDYTLRRGDAVMTGHGFQVFHGASHFPFKPKDFVALAQSRDIRDGNRAAFHAIERVSLAAPKVTPHAAEAAPALIVHQASR